MNRRDYVWVAFGVAQAIVILAYGYAGGSSSGLSPVSSLIPAVWITVGVWAVVETPSPPMGERPSYAPLLAGVGAGYFVLLSYLGGLFGTWDAFSQGLSVTMTSPGWGPLVSYTGSGFRVHAVPFMTVGYASLSYLVFLSLLDAGRSVYGAAVGLFSCVGCTFPLAAAVVGAVGGGATATVGTLGGRVPYELEISTVVFVAAVLLLRRYGVTRSRRTDGT